MRNIDEAAGDLPDAFGFGPSTAPLRRGCYFCYCAGPLVDGYFAWFGVRHRAITVSRFIVGTVFMMLLAGVYAGSVAFDAID